jgi:hypothetical protein
MVVMTQIPRHLLPQIPKDKIEQFREFLESKGIKSRRERRPTSWFLPIQKHVNQEKVDSLVNSPERIDIAPNIATAEGYLVDGHHRWVAARKLKMEDLDSVVCDCNLKDFLKVAHQFDHTYVKSVHELTTYGRLGLIMESKITNLTESAEQKLREYVRNVLRERLTEKKMSGEDPCWKGYQMVGKKTKNGRQVPNCVPKK